MGSSRFSGRRRSYGIAVEVLERRAMLSTVTTSSMVQIQPMGVLSASLQRKAEQSQVGNANAGDALKVGKQYTKTFFSTTTGTVISNYTKALLSGNGKELKSLGDSSEVQQLNLSLKNEANSPQAQSINHSLKSLGNSISNQFHKIFG